MRQNLKDISAKISNVFLSIKIFPQDGPEVLPRGGHFDKFSDRQGVTL
jgi:hypothetical protein